MTKPPRALPQMFSVDELADRLSVSSKTVCRWISAGDIRAHRLGRQLRISEDDAIGFIATRRS